MNNKKCQVFISSAYADLIEERKKILDVLFMADCIPAGDCGTKKWKRTISK